MVRPRSARGVRGGGLSTSITDATVPQRAVDTDMSGARFSPYPPPVEVREDRSPRRWLWRNPTLG
eukprot:6877802-Pyramimonas_sp.AAC.1